MFSAWRRGSPVSHVPSFASSPLLPDLFPACALLGLSVEAPDEVAQGWTCLSRSLQATNSSASHKLACLLPAVSQSE